MSDDKQPESESLEVRPPFEFLDDTNDGLNFAPKIEYIENEETESNPKEPSSLTGSNQTLTSPGKS